MAAGNADKQRLAASVLGARMPTTSTSLAGVLSWNQHDATATPTQLVVELPTKLVPALIENRLVEACLGAHVFTVVVLGTACRSAHISDLQILEIDHLFLKRGKPLAPEKKSAKARPRSLRTCISTGLSEWRLVYHIGPTKREALRACALHPRPERRGFTAPCGKR